MAPTRHDAFASDEMEEGTIYPVTINDSLLILVKSAGEIRAFRGTCTHEEFELDDALFDRGGIVCPLHFSRFDCLTGAVLDGPAELPLPQYPVEIENGRVFISL
jgi:nitrite reductase/ring-hydroxylating ferredoxin subunit